MAAERAVGSSLLSLTSPTTRPEAGSGQSRLSAASRRLIFEGPVSHAWSGAAACRSVRRECGLSAAW